MPPPPPVQILPVDDPRVAELLAAGGRVVAHSWGAVLRLDGSTDPALPAALVAQRDAGRAAGVDLAELGVEAAAELLELQRANRADYSQDPALALPPPDLAQTAAQWLDGGRVFGARIAGTDIAGTDIAGAPVEGALVGATILTVHGGDAATTFTSVLRAYRRQGVATALKAASVLALAADGVHTFRTGGGDDNLASLRANLAVGYVVDEHWVTVRLPD